MTTNIFEEVLQLLSQVDRDWVCIGRLLHKGSQQKVWVTRFGSVRQAIVRISEQSKVKPASLWRFLSSVRIYNELERMYLSHASDQPFPELTSACGAENIELLGRLRRVMPETEFLPVAISVLRNQVSRETLRTLWQDYKPAMQGKTLRGRGKPVVNPDLRSLRKAQILTMIRGSPFWAPDDRLPDIPRHEVLTQVVLPEITWDAVVVVSHSPSKALEFNGVRILDHLPDNTECETLIRMTKYCERVWIAIHIDDCSEENGSFEPPSGIGFLLISDFAGISNRMRVIQPARSGNDVSEALLPRTIVGHLLGFTQQG